MLGDALDDRPQSGNLMPGTDGDRFVPIYDDVNGTSRIVGFGRVRVDWDDSTTTLTIARTNETGSVVAPVNALATFTRPPDPNDFADVLTAFRGLDEDVDQLVRAPALVRSID